MFVTADVVKCGTEKPEVPQMSLQFKGLNETHSMCVCVCILLVDMCGCLCMSCSMNEWSKL